MKTRSQLWREIDALQCIKPQTPEILKQIEQLKEERRNTPIIEPKRKNNNDVEDSEADRMIDHWNNQW